MGGPREKASFPFDKPTYFCHPKVTERSSQRALRLQLVLAYFGERLFRQLAKKKRVTRMTHFRIRIFSSFNQTNPFEILQHLLANGPGRGFHPHLGLYMCIARGPAATTDAFETKEELPREEERWREIISFLRLLAVA